MPLKRIILSLFCGLFLSSCAAMQKVGAGGREENPFVVVLGIAQDGGVPHTGVKDHRGWDDPAFKRLVTSLAIVDPLTSQRWLIDATPDFREQLHRLDKIFPKEETPGLDGIFLTHAHMGHYMGLMFLGYESLSSREVPVYAMPRMTYFLCSNGPWDQLVRYKNISLQPLADWRAVRLNRRLTITPFLVPHRQEYSEVIGFRIQGPRCSVLFIPDIDRWEDLDRAGTKIENLISGVDVAYLDGTFYGDNELPGRDMSTIPHPLIMHSMKRFGSLSLVERRKIRFIHLNHTNPALFPGSDANESIEKRGFRVAAELERVQL